MPENERDQKEEERERRRGGPISRNRIESLSDMIFGLTLSIGALTLITQPPTTPDELTSRVIAFIFNFVILIAVWVQYTTIMSRLPVEKGKVVFANILLLLLIILMSYLIDGIQFKSPPLPIPYPTQLNAFSSQLYAVDLAGITGILAFFSYQLSIEEKHLVAPEFLRRARLTGNLLTFFAILFLVTALPQLWDWSVDQVPLRFALWFVPLIGTICLDVIFYRNPKSK